MLRRNHPAGIYPLVDYNLDGVYDASELIGGAPAHVVGGTDITFTVPLGTASGTTRMRVMHNETLSTVPFDPCASFLWGSTVDVQPARRSLRPFWE